MRVSVRARVHARECVRGCVCGWAGARVSAGVRVQMWARGFGEAVSGGRRRYGTECMDGSEMYLIGTGMPQSHTKIFLSSDVDTNLHERAARVWAAAAVLERARFALTAVWVCTR